MLTEIYHTQLTPLVSYLHEPGERIAKDNGIKDKVITDLLSQRTKYHGTSWAPRLNKEIVEGRFDIEEIIRIERKNDEHTISDKAFDFSYGTIM